jgi:hypothetical protein
VSNPCRCRRGSLSASGTWQRPRICPSCHHTTRRVSCPVVCAAVCGVAALLAVTVAAAHDALCAAAAADGPLSAPLSAPTSTVTVWWCYDAVALQRQEDVLGDDGHVPAGVCLEARQHGSGQSSCGNSGARYAARLYLRVLHCAVSAAQPLGAAFHSSRHSRGAHRWHVTDVVGTAVHSW